MSRLKSWAAIAARSLSHHLDRLRQTLTRLHGRLREAVAEAVSTNTASVVKDAVLAAMLAPELASPTCTPSSRPYDQHRYRDGPDWHDDPYRPAWDRDPYDEPEDYDRDQVDDPTHDAAPKSSQTPVGRIGQALVVGCQVAAWWLRRKTVGRYATLAAIGVGAAAGLTAIYFGPLVAAAAALAGSTLGLTTMAEAMRRGALLLGAGSS